MATKTTNYNLTKPSGSENADIDVINANMDIIDNALGTKANKSEIPDVSGKANLNSSNIFEGDQTIIGKTLLKYGGSDTPLAIQTTASETGCYVELMNASGVTLGYYGALNSHRPVFYVNSNRELAFLDEIPTITKSTSDPSGGKDGDIWFKYE